MAIRTVTLKSDTVEVRVRYLDKVSLTKDEEKQVMDDLADRIAPIISTARFCAFPLTRIRRVG